MELALETLKSKRAEIEREIDEIRELEDGQRRVFARTPTTPSIVVVKRRSKTKAERKAHSERMKKIWETRKLKAAKPPVAVKTASTTTKRKPKTAAEKKALSLKMKQVWAKKKAAAKKA